MVRGGRRRVARLGIIGNEGGKWMDLAHFELWY
jgi:hypothetical protein